VITAAPSRRQTVVGSFVRTWWPWVSIPARLLVGGVWIAAGVLKLEDVDDSIRSVRNFQILPEVIVPSVGRGLPVFEIVIGALLIIGLGVRVTGALSALLQLACGCFGGSGTLVQNASAKYPWEIARDCGLLVLSVLLVVWPRSRLALDDLLLPPSDDEE
jgi:uncharacterized membrane protein YphA (DoxX/SURF4 family)